MDKMTKLRKHRAKSIYDYPPLPDSKTGRYRTVSRPGMGKIGEKKPRMWDGLSRPVQLSITRWWGYPHYFAELKEANNPFLAKYNGELCWITEHDDKEARGKSYHSREFDTIEQCIKWARKTYKKFFNDKKHHLVIDQFGDFVRQIKIRDVIPREGD